MVVELGSGNDDRRFVGPRTSRSIPRRRRRHGAGSRRSGVFRGPAYGAVRRPRGCTHGRWCRRDRTGGSAVVSVRRARMPGHGFVRSPGWAQSPARAVVVGDARHETRSAGARGRGGILGAGRGCATLRVDARRRDAWQDDGTRGWRRLAGRCVPHEDRARSRRPPEHVLVVKRAGDVAAWTASCRPRSRIDREQCYTVAVDERRRVGRWPPTLPTPCWMRSSVRLGRYRWSLQPLADRR
jgi:hypothetical protein